MPGRGGMPPSRLRPKAWPWLCDLARLLALVVLALASPPAELPAIGSMQKLNWRGWTLLNAIGGPNLIDWNATASHFISTTLPAAVSHGINHIQLSQQLSWTVEDLVKDANKSAAIRHMCTHCRCEYLLVDTRVVSMPSH